MHIVLYWALPALAILATVLWPVARERARIKVAWTLLILGGVCWTASLLLPASFPSIGLIQNVAAAFIELAAAQVAAVAILDFLLRRVHVPKFASEIVLVASYLAILFDLLFRAGVNVSGIFATSAVAAAAAGLALQDMLGNIAGGVTLELEGSFKVGDFIQSADYSGWVHHVRMRHTAITTRDGDRVLIPNSQLTRTPVRICSPEHRQMIPFLMSYDINPQQVIDSVEFALRASPIPAVSAATPPQCVIQEMAPGHIKYAAVVWLTRPGLDYLPISAVLTRIYFALQRAGIPAVTIPHQLDIRTQTDTKETPLSPVDVLRRTPILRLLADPDLFAIGAGMKHLSFAPGEHIVRQGDAGDSMFFVVAGSVGISFRTAEGMDNQIAVMHPGDFFGEASLLTGEPRSATAVALSTVDCYRLEKAGFQNVVERVPELPEDMSAVMAYRQMELEVARERADRDAAHLRARQNEIQILAKIRRFFAVNG